MPLHVNSLGHGKSILRNSHEKANKRQKNNKCSLVILKEKSLQPLSTKTSRSTLTEQQNESLLSKSEVVKRNVSVHLTTYKVKFCIDLIGLEG